MSETGDPFWYAKPVSDCSSDDGPVFQDRKDAEPSVRYDSIATMVATLSEGIDRGAVTVEADGSLELDFD